MSSAKAHAEDLTYQYQEKIFHVKVQSTWRTVTQVLSYNGHSVFLPQGTSSGILLPASVTTREHVTWQREAIATALKELIVPSIDRPTGQVTINRNAEGFIIFDGLGLNGRTLDVEETTELTIAALEAEVPIIQLPVKETQPILSVLDAELRDLGIRELVAIGESDFSGSPKNRRHNIAIGLERFNGSLIAKDATFSFNEILGKVDASTGYKPELTIVGERTIPEYGGGLCQVSTTAFRGAWQAGLPITERRNHSFAVRYYAPEGTDATIYPPATDFQFVNDSPGAIILQTHVEGDKAFFLFYGTKPPNRTTELVGPFTWDLRSPPPDRRVETTEIPAGTERVVSNRVIGMKTAWFRLIHDGNIERDPEEFYSYYEARPHTVEIGVEAVPPPIITIPEPEEEVIQLDERTTLTIPRRGEKIRIREEQRY